MVKFEETYCKVLTGEFKSNIQFKMYCFKYVESEIGILKSVINELENIPGTDEILYLIKIDYLVFKKAIEQFNK